MDFLPQNDQIWPKIGIFGQFGPGHAGFFSALLVGRLVVVARGLYLARHLFTLFSRLVRLVVVRLKQFHINNGSRDSPKPAQTLKLNSNLTLRGNLHGKWTPQPDLPGLTFKIQLSRLKTWKDINGIFSQLT